MSKQFHIGDILSITTGRLLAPSGIGGVYEILNFMTGDNLFTHQLPRAGKQCAPYLLKQFPQFDTPEFQIEVGKLIEMLDSESGKAEPKALIAGWLGTMAEKYGEFHEVEDLEFYEMRNPVQEAEEMFGKEKLIVLTVGEETSLDVLESEFIRP